MRRFEEAITAHRDAAAIFRETGDRNGEGIALGNLGPALQEVRRSEEAITACQDAAAISGKPATGTARASRWATSAWPCRGAAVRGGDHRVPGRRGHLPGDRRPARRGQALSNLGARAAGRCGGSRRRSPLTGTPRPSTGRPATGTARARRWATSGSPYGGAAARGGDHRASGRGGHLPGDRRPARRGRGAGQPRRALRQVRRFEEAITAYQDALAIYRETGDRHGEGIALNNLGLALQKVGGSRRQSPRPGRRGDLPGDRRPARRGRGAEQPRPGPAGGAAVRGGDHRLQGRRGHLPGDRRPARREHGIEQPRRRPAEVRRFEEAITARRDAAAIYRETGDRHGEGQALSNLGVALPQVRRYEEAITAYQDAAAIFRETGDRHGEGIALSNLGSPSRKCGGSRRRSPLAGPRRPCSGRPATGTARPEALDSLGLALQEAAIRRGDHRLAGRRRYLPGDRRPARRGHRATQPRRPCKGWAIRRGDHRLAGRRRHLPGDRRPRQRTHCAR